MKYAPLYYLPCSRLFSHTFISPFAAVQWSVCITRFKSQLLTSVSLLFQRAEPILTRMKEDHTRIILPAIDNIKYNTFEVQQYANAAHGYNWGLWCMYIIPPQEWLDKGDETAPIR